MSKNHLEAVLALPLPPLQQSLPPSGGVIEVQSEGFGITNGSSEFPIIATDSIQDCIVGVCYERKSKTLLVFHLFYNGYDRLPDKDGMKAVFFEVYEALQEKVFNKHPHAAIDITLIGGWKNQKELMDSTQKNINYTVDFFQKDPRITIKHAAINQGIREILVDARNGRIYCNSDPDNALFQKRIKSAEVEKTEAHYICCEGEKPLYLQVDATNLPLSRRL